MGEERGFQCVALCYGIMLVAGEAVNQYINVFESEGLVTDTCLCWVFWNSPVNVCC